MYILLIILLLVATLTDVVRHKIPNIISLGGIILGFICQAWYFGMSGITDGLLGMLVGLVLFLPFYALKAMAAGDVKLMAMVGTFLGPKIVIACVAATLISGMILALFYIIIRRSNLKNYLKRYGLMIKTLSITHKWIYIPPATNDAGTMRFPYALAINVGAIIALWYFNITVLKIGS